jgi:hypothetical protein
MTVEIIPDPSGFQIATNLDFNAINAYRAG